MAEEVTEQSAAFARLHNVGWFALSGDEQDALIEEGYHPSPNGGCGRRVQYIDKTIGYCGTNGYCPACWADRNPRVPQAKARS